MSENQDKTQDELSKIEQAIVDMDTMRNMLPAEQFETLMAALRAQQTTLQARLEGSGAIAQDHSVAAGDGGTAIGRDQNIVIITQETVGMMLGDVLRGQPSEEEIKQTTKSYLDFLVQRYSTLQFKGMGIHDKIPEQLSLLEMYVPLKARIEIPKGETLARHLVAGGRRVTKEDAEALGERLSDPLPIPEMLALHSALVVLGDPGAGKTTLLKYLALSLAGGKGEMLALNGRLPVLAPISAYATELDKGRKLSLDQFIVEYYHQETGGLNLRHVLDEVLAYGRGLFLLDGLDEVSDVALRSHVVEKTLSFFSYQSRNGNKFVLTSRIVGYKEIQQALPKGIQQCVIVDFDEKDIELFINHWMGILERKARGDTIVAAQEAERERQEFLQEIERNAGVRQLATNPLLLTILALMKRQGIALPERRARLYEQYVTTLLRHWHLARSLGGERRTGLDEDKMVRVLAPLALWMHQESPDTGRVTDQALKQELISIYEAQGEKDAEQRARLLMKGAREHANLLLEMGSGQYGFIHLTFQEYLAAVGIARLGQQSVEPIVNRLRVHVGMSSWREVSLLCIGYLGLVQKRDDAAGEVLQQLLMTTGKEADATLLAGDALFDVGDSGVTPNARKRVIEALLAMLVDEKDVESEQRASAGRILARLGDPRPGVGLNELGLPDIIWSDLIESGPFTMGNTKKTDDLAYDDEVPQFECDLIKLPYHISRYPITVAQYRAFIKAGGYEQRRYWTKSGWEWRESEDVKEPADFGEPFNLFNHPQVGVSWYEAVAFCSWLSEQTGQDVRLPTEAEWERAARHTDARRYPWGQEHPKERCNMSDTGIGSTCAVGMFPHGDAICGAADVSGNVWEWCITKWQGNYRNYEQEVDDAPDGDYIRVVRGGAFYYNDRYVRCAFRLNRLPHDRSFNRGFRVVFSPSTTGH